MRRGILICTLLTGCAGATPSPSRPPSPEILDAVSTIADTGMRQQEMPGLALVVMKGDEVVLARGFGVEDVQRPEPVTPRTIFALGSISKQFVAAVVLQLAAEGRLSLDDAASTHLPEFTRLPPGLRIRHLLSHTSGVREEFVQPGLGALFDKPGTTFAEYLDVARHSPVDFTPGSRWTYGNINYLMLTVLVERLAGASLEAVLHQRLFAPLELDSIGLCPMQPGLHAGQARGHVRRDGRLQGHPPENVMLFRGSGGYCGNALDIARWTRALASGAAAGPAGYRHMVTRTRLNDGTEVQYGMAMDRGSHDGIQRHGHGGYGGGFSAQVAYYPRTELTTAVLTNRFAFPEHIERKIARRLHDRPEPVLPAAAMTHAELQRYAGRYDVGIRGWPVLVKLRDDGLWFELESPRLSMRLTPLGAHRFVSATDVDGYRLTFSPDARELELVGMGMMTWYGVRQDEPAR